MLTCSSFTEDHLRQILFFLPEAYAFATKQQRSGTNQSPVLSIRKRRLPGVDAVHDTLTDRIDAFSSRVNAYVHRKSEEIRAKAKAKAKARAKAQAGDGGDGSDGSDTTTTNELSDEELRAELDKIELEMAPIPEAASEDAQRVKSKQTLDAVAGAEKSVTEQEMAVALNAPVPEDLKSLPSWLVEKVRRQEQVTKKSNEKSEKAQQERLLSTLPQLSDQLESLSIVKRKSTFAMQEVVKSLAARAPIRGQSACGCLRWWL